MRKIVPIVEGPGDYQAVPVLCTRLLHEIQRFDVLMDTHSEAKGRGNLIKKDGLERLVERAWNRQDCKAVLILIDADADCAANLAQICSKRVLAMGTPRCTVVTVVATMTYEAWFLASLPAIAGRLIREDFTLPEGTTFERDVEAKSGVKEWLTSKVPLVSGHTRIAYDEVRDQVTMTRLIDTTLARERSRSFRRLCHALEQILDAVDNNKIVVTPEAS